MTETPKSKDGRMTSSGGPGICVCQEPSPDRLVIHRKDGPCCLREKAEEGAFLAWHEWFDSEAREKIVLQGGYSFGTATYAIARDVEAINTAFRRAAREVEAKAYAKTIEILKTSLQKMSPEFKYVLTEKHAKWVESWFNHRIEEIRKLAQEMGCFCSGITIGEGYARIEMQPKEAKP